MTKILTEQWRDGTLKNGNYYTVCYKGWSKETYPCNLYYSEKIGFGANVKEVLAPVPSFEQCQGLMDDSKELDKAYGKIKELETKCHQLENKIAIATKELNGIRDVWANNPNQFSYIARIANRKAKTALEEMEGVKWQK